MRRTIIAATWVAGTTIPLALAAVFIFGCCVLPFHGFVHRAIPLCHMAIDFLGGDHDAHHGDHHPAPPAEKQQIAGPSLLTILVARQSVVRSSDSAMLHPRYSPVAHRSFISLGATRCDQDVGLQQLLLDTFRI